MFKTGLRISEFCGLTISDIDFNEHTINIDHQLQKKSKIGYYIQAVSYTHLVTWYEDYVEVILSGEEQDDKIYEFMP